jgi:methionyl-tRNA synthetase
MPGRRRAGVSDARGTEMSRKFYITTAIDYVNATPHIGTAYEKIAADFIARARRLCGDDVRFVMGNDEHSINVAREAAARGLDPLAYCDEMETRFRDVWRLLDISFDDFVRTTQPRHRRAVQELFARVHAAGDIYRGKYSGYYCESCEAFYLERDLVDGKCPTHKREARWLEEENWFFALSRFGDRLRSLLTEEDGFVQPDIRRNELLKVIDGGLEDISVSRSGATWGIPLPLDPTHVVYVWFDALINYISALGWPDDSEGLYRRYWPADLHVIGKDITRFHCLIWPAMLASAGLPLPRRVWGHGFVSVNGEKLSKSLGNVVDPKAVVERFGVDGFRYLFLREVPFNRDGDFSWTTYAERYNADLANDLGNLLSRTLAMVQRYLDGEVPALDRGGEDERDTAALAALETAARDYRAAIDVFAIHSALAATAAAVQAANRYVDDTKPWALAKDPAAKPRLRRVLRNLLEVLAQVSVMVQPAMPTKAAEMRRQLGLGSDFAALRFDSELRVQDRAWSRIEPGTPLFPRLEPQPEP